MLFTVTYSARRFNASGIFYAVDVEVDAAKISDAKELAFDWLHENEYETNHCICVKPTCNEPDDGSMSVSEDEFYKRH